MSLQSRLGSISVGGLPASNWRLDRVERQCAADPLDRQRSHMTAYRQRALACAAALAQGPRRPRDLKADIPDAPKILRGNVYGWFVPVERGVYTLAESGRAALLRWPQSAPPTVQHAPSRAYRNASEQGFPSPVGHRQYADERDR